jgi:hypothetical protein
LTTQPDKETRSIVAQALADVFGPLFADTSADEWNRLNQEGRVVYEDGRAVGVRETPPFWCWVTTKQGGSTCPVQCESCKERESE